MHVLPRPHLPTALAVTLIAALLSVVLTLAIAGRLNDRAPASGSATASSVAGTVQASAALPARGTSPFTRTPFSNLLTAPVSQPWAQSR